MTEELYPATCMQEELWHFEAHSPGSGALVEQVAMSISGNVDRSALDKSFLQVVGRHSALRMQFELKDSRVFQRAVDTCEFVLKYHDGAGWTQESSAQWITECALDERKRGFDLSRAPLLRVSCLLHNPDEPLILVTAHHIIADGWSLNELILALTHSYSALRVGRTSEAGHASDYGVFAMEERRYLLSAACREDRSYWSRRLSSVSEVAFHPFTGCEVHAAWGPVERLPLVLDRRSVERVKALARLGKCTSCTVLLAAILRWLQISSRHSSVAVALPISIRHNGTADSVIGLCINTIIIAIHNCARQTFAETVSSAQRAMLECRNHTRMPLSLLRASSEVQMENPVDLPYDVELNYHHSPATSRGSKLGSGGYSFAREAARQPVLFALFEEAAGIQGYIEFRTDLFNSVQRQELMLGFSETLQEALFGMESHSL